MKLFFFLLFIFQFSYANDQTFIDKQSHLQWQDSSSAEEKEDKWAMSGSYCRTLNLGGYRDWRLPSIAELQTLVPVAQGKISGKKLQHNSLSDYWTNEEYKEDDTNAWEIYMGTGHHFFNDKCETAHVRCVRVLSH